MISIDYLPNAFANDDQLQCKAMPKYAINVNTRDILIHGSTPSVNDFKERIKSLLRNCISDCLEYENISIKIYKSRVFPWFS